MNILFVVKLKNLVLIEGSYRSQPITLTIEPRMVDIL